ncbi:siphovirus Gp157 family protein [Enterococcus nangangensis]|uniref:siphovirus Gp157 family protein n=1 Tax=Enterococcus nangangensis TaxID=2559926 RepID=UPI0010F63CB0|nr:siphovirus Gp157 family protein [Enterococcus nangangensis]
MNLYELKASYQALLERAEDLDPTAFHDTLDAITDAIEDKAIGYASVIQQFKADSKALSDEIKRLTERKQSIEKRISIMQESLQDAMEESNVDKIKSAKFTVWLQNNPVSVKVTDERLIPKGFYIPQEPKLDKKALKEELQHGDIPGAELEQTRGVRIR